MYLLFFAILLPCGVSLALGRCCSVEVGCGTGDVMLSLAGDFKHSLGLDINDGFLEYARQHTPEEFKAKVWCGVV